MLTYDLNKTGGLALYEHLYSCIKKDITDGTLSPDEHLPSKRSLAAHLGVSTITIENTYAQLMSEGYIYSLPKKGYYVSDISGISSKNNVSSSESSGFASKNYSFNLPVSEDPKNLLADFSSNRTSPDTFPFSVWAKLMREIISEKSTELLEKSDGRGVYSLRKAISDHLLAFRGMKVNPECIIIGAGTEYLYGLLILLLGRSRLYCIERPGYSIIEEVYRSNGVQFVSADLDDCGIIPQALYENGSEIVHISPTHHFPTGITMPIARRYELLTWAHENEKRYIIEDDYDSEFRLTGRPIPSLYSIDEGRVIYMNTFSKSLSGTLRVSYMVLPPALMKQFISNLGFYSCTVSNFEQYTLARFIEGGYFEKHLNRMRLHFSKKRENIIRLLKESPLGERSEIIEKDSGTHFLLKLDTALEDETLSELLLKKGIRLFPVSKYYSGAAPLSYRHCFICNYTRLETEELSRVFGIIYDTISQDD